MLSTPRVRKRLLWGGLIGAVLLLVLAGLWFRAGVGPHGWERRAWKDRAIAEIAVWTADAKGLASEAAALSARTTANPESDAWISERLLVMKNGEWIAYASICQKENFRIPDLFVGRGSDGKWYYSTFHFCIQMVVLRMDERQPESLAQFCSWYYLEEFDGRSDDCLSKTWPLPRGTVDPKAAERGWY